MATWFAQNSSVNIDSVNQWNSVAGGGGTVLTWASLAAGDILVANGKTSIAINVDVTCAQLTNTIIGGSTVGGGFVVTSSGTITIVLGGSGMSITSSTLITFSGSGTLNITSVNSAGSSVTGNVSIVLHSGIGTLNYVGNVTGLACSVDSSSYAQFVIDVSSTGTLFVTGTVTGGSRGNGFGGSRVIAGIRGSVSSFITVTGSVLGGTGLDVSGTFAGITSSGTVTVVGNLTGGSTVSSVRCEALECSGTVTITGNSTGSTLHPGLRYTGAAAAITGNAIAGSGSVGVTNTGTLTINGNLVPSASTPAIDNTGLLLLNGSNVSDSTGRVSHTGNGRFGMPSAGVQTWSIRGYATGVIVAERVFTTAGANQATTADVRSGTSYGGGTGTLAVPSPTLVAIGVSTDNTVGSYAPTGGLDAAGVRTAIGLATANLDTQLSGIQSDTNDIQTRLPAALESGRIAAALDSGVTDQIDAMEAAIALLRVSESRVVERSLSDTNAITFAWPVSGATITATRSINNETYGAVQGAIAFLRTESSKHYYTLAFDVDDRPAAEGQVRYKFEDGTYTRYVVLRTVNLVTVAQVNAQVLDVLSVDTFGELGSPPAATSSLKDKLVWLFMWARNKATATSSQRKLYADDVTTVVSTETITDDGTTFTKGESL